MYPSVLQQLTLDQLLLFVTVAEAGSFSEAARRLDRVQSTISHGVGQLERQLGLLLFDRSTRKPGLTRSGAHLLLQAKQILSQVHNFRSEAQLLQAGHEPYVSLVLDMIVPVEILTRSLKVVQQSYPKVRWLLHTEMLSAITQRVLDGSSQLGLTGQLMQQHRSKLDISPLGQVDFVFVVSQSHPLAQTPAPLSAVHLARYTHLAVADRGYAHYPEGDSWYLADLHTLLHFVKEGFGWAFLPRHLVEPALQAGALMQLQLDDRRSVQPFTIYSIRLKSEKNGPVREALTTALKKAFAGAEDV